MSTQRNTKADALGILQSRTPISAPGKYVAKVTNCADFHKDLAKGGSQVAIANFSAMSPWHMAEAKKALSAGNYDDALNFNFSASIRSTDYRPAKGEIVNIEVGLIKNKAGIEALVVTSLTPRQAIAVATKCDFSEFLEDAEAPVVASTEELED